MALPGEKVAELVGPVFTAVGLVFLGCAVWFAKRQYTILKSWPVVDAEVTSSKVARYTTNSMHGSAEIPMYRVEIDFRYVVDGKTYLTPSSSSSGTSSYPEAKRKADFFASGTRHPISYNPVDPNDVRFDVGYNFDFLFLPIFFAGMGILFGGIGLGLLKASASARAPAQNRGQGPEALP